MQHNSASVFVLLFLYWSRLLILDTRCSQFALSPQYVTTLIYTLSAVKFKF